MSLIYKTIRPVSLLQQNRGFVTPSARSGAETGLHFNGEWASLVMPLGLGPSTM